MITLTVLLTFIGFEFFYQTSKKAEFQRIGKLASWFARNEKPAKIYGTILFGFALTFSIIQFGVGSGIFTFLSILMLIASLVVLLSPLRTIKFSWLMLGIAVLFLVEIF